jgi:hypothetical protein
MVLKKNKKVKKTSERIVGSLLEIIGTNSPLKFKEPQSIFQNWSFISKMEDYVVFHFGLRIYFQG